MDGYLGDFMLPTLCFLLFPCAMYTLISLFFLTEQAELYLQLITKYPLIYLSALPVSGCSVLNDGL